MPRITEILLLGHTHHDVGYTGSPRVVDRRHRRAVGEVLDLCDRHAEPGPEQFRWTFEVARPVLEFVRTAPRRDVERLAELVRAGRISVTGGYLNMTQLIGEHELDASYEQLDDLARAGIRVRTEQHGDVNGIAWGAVTAMRRAGIDRLVMALNPDHGRPPFTQPTGFWWEGPDGEAVFVWLSTHYGIGEQWGIVDGEVKTAEQHIARFVCELESRADYPYGVALVHAANDNRWPTARFLDVVRHWNATHPETPMRTATVDEALDRVLPTAERTAAPTVRGEWSDWWSHGHGSTARDVALYRSARTFALTGRVAHALARLREPVPVPTAEVIGYRRGPVQLRDAAELSADLAMVDEQLLLFDEHTWGSWESYSSAGSDFTHSHWNAKAGFACAAHDWGRDVAVEGMVRLLGDSGGGGPDTTRVAVLNPTARPRTEPVSVEVDLRRRVLLARDVPAFGVAWFDLPPSPRPGPPARTIATARYELTVDPRRGGVASLVERATGRELVDGDAEHGLGAVVVEQVAPGSDHPMVTRDPKHFRPEDPGPEFVLALARQEAEPTTEYGPGHAAITWRASGPHLDEVRTTVRLYDDVDLVDVEVRVTKPEVFAPESVFVAFPFDVPGRHFWLETAGAVFRAGDEQLPDTCMDWYSIQHAAAVVDGAGDGVLWGSFDAPLVQVGDVHTGRWARELRTPTGHLNSWIMNNLHFTNFRAAQGGTATFRYRFAPGRGLDRADVRHLGRAVLQPLAPRVMTGPTAMRGSAGLEVEPAEDVLVDLAPGADEAEVRIRLRAVRDSDVPATVRWTGPGSVELEAGPAGRPGGDDGRGAVRVVVPRHGVVDLLARRS
ncbi:hypothetical protein GCM10023169_21350 [Georgenia halophila]|uniref:Glycoside hydrolase family 38 N-terminal domain-containing protein n=1 Tax=Georgenia halophila TaxID=620889 RepID=A0ABP8LAB3_9MICO